MIDQKQSNSISKVIGLVFILFGFVMLCIGLSLIVAPNKGQFENTIMALFIISGVLMLIGGYQNIKKAKVKDEAVNAYEEEIKSQLRKNSVKTGSSIMASDKLSNAKPEETYKPDIIATWNYTREDWKLMTKEETNRRLKEAIWVSLGIGLLGGWVLTMARGATFLMGFIVSLSVGIFLSLLKVVLANNLFTIRKNNSIVITTDALIINGKFKTIHDNDIRLQYVKTLKIKDDHFIEFSLQWLTRRGDTNDQFRIYVPKMYEHEIQKVLDYYSARGVRNWE